MGMFGKKKNKSKKELNTEPAAPAPAPAPRPQQVIKIVGDSKHITTTSIDEHGRQVTQTQIKKLTAAERQQMGLPPAPVAPPPPQAAKPAPPPPMYDDRNNNQYHNNSNQYQNNSNNNMMRTPQSLDDVRSTQSSANGAGSASGASTSQNLQPDDRLASIEVTRELVKRFISDIWNRGEIELIPSVCHPSLRFNGHVGMDRVGHEGFSRMVTTVRESLTDYHCEIHSMVVETNKAFCRLRFTGKHTGNLLGFPPTGKTVAWMGASEFTCKNGKILKVWELGDVKSLEEQLRSAE